MAATLSISTIIIGWNNAALTAGIWIALTALLGPPPYIFTSGNVVSKVYEVVYTSSYSKGTAWLVVGVNAANNYIYWQLFDGWNSSTNQGTNGSAQLSITTLPSTSSAITVVSISDAEFLGIILQQSGWSINDSCIGLFRPTYIVSDWNQNNYLFAFVSSANAPFNFNQWLFPSSNPFNNLSSVAGSVYCDFLIRNSSGVCPYQYGCFMNSNEPDLLPNLVLGQPVSMGNPFSGVGVSASFGIAGGTFNFQDTITLTNVSPNQIYTGVYVGTTKPNFFIRTQ